MAGGIKALRFIQIGLETTAGTAVAATAIWRGLGTIEDARETLFPEEDVALIGGDDRTYVPRYLAQLSMDPVVATFEQLPYLLAAGVKNITSGTQDGTQGSGYSYTYPVSNTSKNTISTFTIEGGDDQQEEEFAYGFVTDIKLSGAAGEALMMSGDWVGRQVAPSTKTGALSIVAVDEILFGKGKLYIDTAGGTIGTTLKSSTFIGLDLSIKTGYHPVFTDGGNLYFDHHNMDRPEVLAEVTFLHDATAVAELAAYRAETTRQLRFQFDGPALTTTGTYTTKLLRVDLAGKWESFEKIGENDGNDIVTGTFRARYNATAALFASFVVVNESTALA